MSQTVRQIVRVRPLLLAALGIVASGTLFLSGCASRGGGAPDPNAPGDDPPPGLPELMPALRTPRPADVPPPISGGTLLVARDGHTAIAADPDRDRVWIVDLSTRTLLKEVALLPGDEPGRLVEDDAGRIHVALRSGGAVATIDRATGAVTQRRPVCAAPRGLAHENVGGMDRLHVACAGGELVTLPADGELPLRTLFLEPGLRDVVVQGGYLMVSRFREAQLLVLGADGKIDQRLAPQPLGAQDGSQSQPAVAWRTIALPGGSVAMLHQRAGAAPVSISSGGYGATTTCNTSLVHGAVTVMGVGSAPPLAPPIPGAVLPVDLAVSHDGSRFAIIAAGNALGQVQVLTAAAGEIQKGSGCVTVSPADNGAITAATAVAFDGMDRVVVQAREPAALYIIGDANPITLPGASRANVGHALFHTMTRSMMACASCHPETGDDGHVWQFQTIGPRRTQTIRGGFLELAPFHWDGTMKDFTQLVNEVFVNRMSGTAPPADQIGTLASWLNAQPALPPPPLGNVAAAQRGQALFHDVNVGCVGCHNGAKFTGDAIVDVGTGGAFKIPSLVAVVYRAPFIHNGCAPTLRDRFGACAGGDRHGKTSQLTEGQLGDLIAYLQSL